MARPFRAAFVGAAAVTVFGAVTGREKLQWAAKPLLMPLLAADVAVNGKYLDRTDRTVLLGSLAAATVGDVLLIEPDDDRRLIAGASSFAVMQTGYSWLWFRHGGRPRAQIAGPRLAAWWGRRRSCDRRPRPWLSRWPFTARHWAPRPPPPPIRTWPGTRRISRA
ncbi:lysoplasmalogenase family protein [Nocardia seriolae]|uniref:lysoplasmalogenase family protein n=1 Tax=Nocardia seriolae TaxID=37332 RepID=UPI000AF46717|nr:lysoplasmalogenase family protein [Nocardia seriolae]